MVPTTKEKCSSALASSLTLCLGHTRECCCDLPSCFYIMFRTVPGYTRFFVSAWTKSTFPLTYATLSYHPVDAIFFYHAATSRPPVRLTVARTRLTCPSWSRLGTRAWTTFSRSSPATASRLLARKSSAVRPGNYQAYGGKMAYREF